MRGGNTQLGKALSNQVDCGDGFLDLSVRAVHAGHIAQSGVPSADEHSAAQRCFYGGENVIAIQIKRQTTEAVHLLLPRTPVPQFFPRACAALQRQSLPGRQLIAITHQLERRGQRVTPIEEPAEITERRQQPGILAGREEFMIFGMRTTMLPTVRHEKSVLPKHAPPPCPQNRRPYPCR